MKSSSDFTANSPKTVEQLRAELERARLETAQLRAELEKEKLLNELKNLQPVCSQIQSKKDLDVREPASKKKKSLLDRFSFALFYIPVKINSWVLKSACNVFETIEASKK